MRTCRFCAVVKENKPHHEIIWSNKTHIAFLDAFPLLRGHILVIPKKHTDRVFDLSKKDYDALWSAVRSVSALMDKTFHPKRVGIVVDGFSVPHVHVHLLPVNKSPKYDIERMRVTPRYLARLASEFPKKKKRN